jgi:hypothetical protein
MRPRFRAWLVLWSSSRRVGFRGQRDRSQALKRVRQQNLADGVIVIVAGCCGEAGGADRPGPETLATTFASETPQFVGVITGTRPKPQG